MLKRKETKYTVEDAWMKKKKKSYYWNETVLYGNKYNFYLFLSF